MITIYAADRSTLSTRRTINLEVALVRGVRHRADDLPTARASYGALAPFSLDDPAVTLEVTIHSRGSHKRWAIQADLPPGGRVWVTEAKVVTTNLQHSLAEYDIEPLPGGSVQAFWVSWRQPHGLMNVGYGLLAAAMPRVVVGTIPPPPPPPPTSEASATTSSRKGHRQNAVLGRPTFASYTSTPVSPPSPPAPPARGTTGSAAKRPGPRYSVPVPLAPRLPKVPPPPEPLEPPLPFSPPEVPAGSEPSPGKELSVRYSSEVPQPPLAHRSSNAVQQQVVPVSVRYEFGPISDYVIDSGYPPPQITQALGFPFWSWQGATEPPSVAAAHSVSADRSAHSDEFYAGVLFGVGGAALVAGLQEILQLVTRRRPEPTAPA